MQLQRTNWYLKNFNISVQSRFNSALEQNLLRSHLQGVPEVGLARKGGSSCLGEVR